MQIFYCAFSRLKWHKISQLFVLWIYLPFVTVFTLVTYFDCGLGSALSFGIRHNAPDNATRPDKPRNLISVCHSELQIYKLVNKDRNAILCSRLNDTPFVTTCGFYLQRHLNSKVLITGKDTLSFDLLMLLAALSFLVFRCQQTGN